MSHPALKSYPWRLIPLSLSIALLVGCFGADEGARYSGGAPLGGPTGAISRPALASPGSATPSFPWELLWREGYAVSGQEVSSILLRQGDRALAGGDRSAALAVYQKARASGLNPADQESAVVRVTAMQLSLGQADVALRTASDYFAASRKQVGDVSPEFSLLFGYAYGQRNDFDQALAWLARARAVSPPQSRFAFASQEEVAAVLRSVPEKQFEDIAAMWAGDEFIRAEIGTERLRRSRGGEVAPGEKSALVKSPLLNPGEVRLGALLPLQGRFAALGRTVQNGIELAVAGQGADPVVRLTVQDSGDTSEQAAAAAGTLAQSSQPTVVLGPLVSEQAHAVRSVLDAQGVPSLSFSKRSDFIPGAAVFRLGVTVESQVESLLATTHDRMGVTRYAVVGSSDPALTEVAEVFRRKLRELGLQLVFDKVYQRGVKDAAAALAAELENQPVEAVFFADNSALASTVYAGMSEESRKRVLPLGIGNWDNRPQLMSSRTVLNGAVFVSPFFPQSSRPIVGGFISAYRGKYGQEPDFLAAQGFDAATMVLQAAKRAQATMMPLPEAIRGIDIYDGLTGRVYVGADGELRRAFAVVQLRGDALVELNAPEAAAGQLTSGESVLNGAATAPVVAPTKGPVVAPPPPEAPTLGSVMKP